MARRGIGVGNSSTPPTGWVAISTCLFQMSPITVAGPILSHHGQAGYSTVSTGRSIPVVSQRFRLPLVSYFTFSSPGEVLQEMLSLSHLAFLPDDAIVFTIGALNAPDKKAAFIMMILGQSGTNGTGRCSWFRLVRMDRHVHKLFSLLVA